MEINKRELKAGTTLQVFQLFHKYEAKVLTEIRTTGGTIEANCQAISFLNTGDVDIKILDIPLAVGDSMLSFNGEIESVDTTRYKFSFDPLTTGVNPKLLIIRRFVTKLENQLPEQLWQE